MNDDEVWDVMDTHIQEEFDDLELSYYFRFNSIQFLLLCWKNTSEKIQLNNVILENQYPYTRFLDGKDKVTLQICTNEINYHHPELIHVSWDRLIEVGHMRKKVLDKDPVYQENMKKMMELWNKEEQRLASGHKR